ncbi:hypothetical protein EXW34_31280 (plasmid) [Bacillus mycoides]|uniref:hypothetical protein n=1 Tax=Bacillus mycoides TaxID=1405 RepID=UPI001C015C9E|nr:hypothetical protein [Bacillus mycoides]QWI25655.1 hypothetical protein EXW34_31280 [Bacillus mycoides]
MHYNELDVPLKRSFLKSIDKAIDRQFYGNELDPEENFVTMEFVEGIKDTLKGISEGNNAVKWKSVSFDFTDEDLLFLVQRNVASKRKRKKTDKQINYYKNMARTLGESEEVPDDFLIFQKKLELLTELYNVEGPATEKQIAVLQNMWSMTFGKELVVRKNITRKEVDDFFKLVKEEAWCGDDLFDYLYDKRYFTTKLARIIALDIVWNEISSFAEKSIYNLNRMDRYELAVDALKKIPKSYLDGSDTEEELLTDMAKYIDRRIPISYAIEMADNSGESLFLHKKEIKAEEYGLIYHFDENSQK